MALYDSLHEHTPDIRDDYHALQKEVRNVKHMFAGAAIAHRGKSHKSVMLSSAALEYYEATEGCRELAYIRGILKDFYGAECPSTPTYIDN